MEASTVKIGALFNSFRVEGAKKNVFDNKRMLLNLKKGESVVVFEKDSILEVYKNSRGRSKVTELKKNSKNKTDPNGKKSFPK